jgi:hypothetical protein
MDVLLDDSILNSITEDGAVIDDLYPDVFKEWWLSIISDNKVIGVCCIHVKTSLSCVGHIHILKEHRKEYSKSAGFKILEWVKRNTPFKQLITEVPVIYPNVINYLKEFEFNEVGVISGAFKKNQKAHDLMILSRGL